MAVLAGQLSVGWCNDAADAARDTATGQARKPIVIGLVAARTVRSAATVALLLAVPLSLLSGLAAATVHLIAVAAAWAYNLRLKSTLLSWAPYTLAFGLVPLFVALGQPGHELPPWWLTAAAALLGLAAHLANVLPDIAADLTTGVRGLPQRLGVARVRALAPVPSLLAVALLVLAPPGPPEIPGWSALTAATALTVTGWALGARHARLPFATVVGVAAIGVLLLLAQGSG